MNEEDEARFLEENGTTDEFEEAGYTETELTLDTHAFDEALEIARYKEMQARHMLAVRVTAINAAAHGAIPRWLRYVPDAPRQMSYTVNVRDAIVARIPQGHLRDTYSALHPVTGVISSNDD